jgi:hypothetical protein
MGTLVKSDHLQVESLNMSPVTLARVLRVGRALLGRVVGFIFVLTVAQASAETQFVTMCRGLWRPSR